MTLTDIIILIVVLGIVAIIIYNRIKTKDESICASCSYAKGCSDKMVRKKA